MEKKTSSVEWLVKEISEILGKIQTTPMQDLLLVDAIKQAKEMRREEIEEAWETAHQAGRFEGKGIAEKDWQTFRQYYNETYGSTKQD